MRGGHFLWDQYFRYPIRRPPTSNMLSIGHACIPTAKYQRRRDSIVEILRASTRIDIQVCISLYMINKSDDDKKRWNDIFFVSDSPN